jgi:hypothetical protein
MADTIADLVVNLGLPLGRKRASLLGRLLVVVRQRSEHSDMAEDAADFVVLDAGFHLEVEGLPVSVVSIAGRQGLVFGLECSDVGGRDAVDLPSLLQLFKPDLKRINIIHIFNDFETRD